MYRAAADDPIADREVGDRVADLDDLAAEFEARDERKLGLNLVFAPGKQHIGKIDRNRARPDEHLACTDRGRR